MMMVNCDAKMAVFVVASFKLDISKSFRVDIYVGPDLRSFNHDLKSNFA
jgi:hypothetical protein